MKKIGQWIADRFGIGVFWKAAMDRRVPKPEWYFGDGATLMVLLGILVATGVAMAMTYSPNVDTAFESVRYLTERQFLGRFVRGLHYWSAGLMVVMLFFHVLRQVLLGGYKFPREGTWMVGVGLFFLVIFMSYTGYVLRWDERSIHSIRVAMHMFQNVPVIGDDIVRIIQGGQDAGPLLLTRVFALHVILVPLLLLGLVGWHLYLVVLHGTTSKTEREVPVPTPADQRRIYDRDKKSEERGETFFPETAASSGLMASVFVVLAFALAALVGPPELTRGANLTETTFPAEEWWFWWYSGLIALLPSAIAPGFVIVFPAVLFLAMVLLPLLDRGPFRGIRRRPFALAFVSLTTLALLALSAIRRESPWTGWPLDEPPPVPPGITLSASAEEGRQLFARFGCNSCHAVAGHGRQVAVDLTHLDGRMSHAELERYILQPPEGVAMPAYEGRIQPDDLARIVDFVLAAQTFPSRP